MRYAYTNLTVLSNIINLPLMVAFKPALYLTIASCTSNSIKYFKGNTNLPWNGMCQWENMCISNFNALVVVVPHILN